ncbi:MAG TPA: hypothetical protein PKO06_06710 [Candidatus Ozemobacteraceae bacterium]|nr:hypothetical protein [Candidatus Ozemobacteraceae bacterium]
MELQKLAQDARLLLQSRGSTEIPAFTGMLPFAWAHPDLLIQALRTGTNDRFFLQPALQGPESRGVERFSPYLVWFLQPFSAGWLTRLCELVSALLGNTDSGAASFEMSGRKPSPQMFVAPGAVWQVSWQAAPIGEIQVWTKLLGEDLTAPAGVCVVNLNQISAIRAGEASMPQTPWSSRLPAEEILAWQRSPRLAPDAEGLFPARLAQERWEGLRTQIDAHLGNRRWLEAYRTSMEAAVLLLDGQACGLSGETFRAGVEPVLQELLNRIPPLLQRKSTGTGKGTREAVLR